MSRVAMYGANLKAVKTIEKIAGRSSPIGVPGTGIWGGFIQDNEKDSSLSGRSKYRTFSNNLATIPIIAASVRYYLNLIGNAKWAVTPADDSPQAKEYAEIVEDIQRNLKTPWSKVIRKAATFKLYGFSIQVWTAFKREDGVIGISRIDSRPQSTIEKWNRDKWGDIESMVQISPQDSQELTIPRNRCLYIVDDILNDSPEGLGLFRHLAEPAKRLIRLQVLEAMAFETSLAGIPIIKGPFAKLRELVSTGEMGEAERLAIVNPLEDIAKNHVKTVEMGILLDSLPYVDDQTGSISSTPQWSFELLQSTDLGQEQVAAAIQREVESIARILNAQGLLLGAGPTGSRALGEVESANAEMTVASTLIEIEDSLNNDFIGPIGSMNGWDKDLWPKFTHEAVNITSVETVSRILHNLASSGVLLDQNDPVINYIRNALRVPEAPEFDNDNAARDSSLVRGNEDIEEEDDATNA